MYRLILVVLALCIAPCLARAQGIAPHVVPGYEDAGPPFKWTPYGPSLPSSPSATTPVAGAQYGLALASATTLTVPATTRMANVVIEGQSIRCTTDGATTPTASVGSLYPPGTFLQVWGTALTNLKCIQIAATATIDSEYFR